MMFPQGFKGYAGKDLLFLSILRGEVDVEKVAKEVINELSFSFIYLFYFYFYLFFIGLKINEKVFL